MLMISAYIIIHICVQCVVPNQLDIFVQSSIICRLTIPLELEVSLIMANPPIMTFKAGLCDFDVGTIQSLISAHNRGSTLSCETRFELALMPSKDIIFTSQSTTKAYSWLSLSLRRG